jgi:hypothetical protein
MSIDYLAAAVAERAAAALGGEHRHRSGNWFDH